LVSKKLEYYEQVSHVILQPSLLNHFSQIKAHALQHKLVWLVYLLTVNAAQTAEDNKELESIKNLKSSL